MPDAYDVIIIGGGPNGLTCSAYLAKAGLRVLVVDKKHEFGGGLYTEDYGTPFRFNAHATYMMLGELMPPHHDLGLPDRGVQYIRPETQAAFLQQDGTALTFYTDPTRSAESVKQLSSKDAQTFERMYEEFAEIANEFIIPATYDPPLPIGEQMELLNETPLGRRVAEISEWTPREIVASYEFEDPRVEGAILHLATMWGLHPEVGGVGFMVPLYVTRMMNAALVRGGTHSLASALYGVTAKNGADILEWSEVTDIILENGAAKGVALRDGTEFRSRAVVSTLPPDLTFLKFVGADHLPADLVAAAEGWEWEENSLFTSHIGIKGDSPRYAASASNPDVDNALIAYLGVESPDDVMRHFDQIENGQLPDLIGNVSCTSLHDPLQASPGPYGPLHTLRWEMAAPYDLDGHHWDDVKQDYADQCWQRWTEYAPNLTDARILNNFVFSPLDIERRLTHMRRGSIKHGAYTSMQMGAFRPHEDCADYRTPVEGLYVGGASAYPGGMVIMGPGYNSARAVAQDLGGELWWSPPDYVERAREKGYLPKNGNV